jgi:hypothetical protein
MAGAGPGLRVMARRTPLRLRDGIIWWLEVGFRRPTAKGGGGGGGPNSPPGIEPCIKR